MLSGKKYMLSITTNAPLESFEDPDQFFNGKDVDALFSWLHKNFEFCGMNPLPTFTCYDVLKNPDVAKDFVRLKEHFDKVFVE